MAAKKKESKKENSDYGADQISILEGLEPVRKRPGMYIGSTGPEGLHHMIWEIFDNSRDEAMAGHANRIEVSVLKDGTIRVADNGRGIPVDKHKKTKVSALETIMTTLHAGGKFGDGGYKISGGLHGVGASVVNALSIYMKAEVHKDGGIHVQEYSQGQKKAAVKKVGTTKHQGSIIYFKPDETIFKESTEFVWKKIVTHLRGQAYLVKGLEINVVDMREHEGPDPDTYYYYDADLDVPTQSFYFEGGLRSLVKFLNKHQKPVHKHTFYIHEKVNEDGEAVEVAFQYVDDISARIFAYANNIPNAEGGYHLTGFKTALTRIVNSYAKKNNILKEKDGALTGDDILEGLTAVISVHLREPQFEGQTKGKLGSTEAKGMVESTFGKALQDFLEEHPDDAKAMINKGLLAMRARKAAKAAKDSVLRKGALEGMTLPGKLADCQSKKASDSELFIVEGDSAGGSAKQGRDRRTQAILPLRGKILNVERARLDRMLGSEQIKNLVIALVTAIGDTFDIERLRYHKIIIATDADVDGDHIRTLLLTLFFRHFRPLIEGGYVYIAQPPLYKIKKGKEQVYVYSDDEKFKVLESWGIKEEDTSESEGEDQEGEEVVVKRVPKAVISRFKGLGEMDAKELFDTTMDIDNRILKQVTIDDGAAADSVFDTLMGSEVAPRKAFIVANAKLAEIDL